MADYGVWQGLEKTTGNMAATGMGLLQYKAGREDAANNLRIRQEQLSIQKGQAEREQKTFEYQQKQQAEIDAAKNKLMDVTTDPNFLKLQPEEQKAWLNYFASNGYTDATGKGKTIDVLTGFAAVGKSKELSETLLAPRVENLKKAAVAAFGEHQDAMVKNPDDKKIPQLKAAYAKANEEYLAVAGKYAEHLSKIQLAEAKKTEKATPNITGIDPITGKPVRTPDVPGAKVYQKPDAPKEETFDKNIMIAAQAAGVSAQKVKSGKLTQPEAIKVADEYQKRFGTESLLKILFGGALPGTPAPGQSPVAPALEFDDKGNLK